MSFEEALSFTYTDERREDIARASAGIYEHGGLLYRVGGGWLPSGGEAQPVYPELEIAGAIVPAGTAAVRVGRGLVSAVARSTPRAGLVEGWEALVTSGASRGSFSFRRALPSASADVAEARGQAVAAESLSPKIRELSEANITDSGITVLGRYKSPPGTMNYIQKATSGKYRGASYFDLGDAWTPIEGKSANQHFLDIVGGRGDKIIFSTPKNKIPPGTSLDMEVKYLKEKFGYKWVNQWSMQKR
ncbi:MAG: hypothetical protein U1D97_02465 [Desulfuromonadales bacterium]|nr:hypothetical protein [Desulfuromonadales bacterium]